MPDRQLEFDFPDIPYIDLCPNGEFPITIAGYIIPIVSTWSHDPFGTRVNFPNGLCVSFRHGSQSERHVRALLNQRERERERVDDD